MRCKKARILLSANLDGELSQREELTLERHLSACRGCAQEKAGFAMLRETMSLWADEEPSAWLAESFAYKLNEPREQPRPAKGRRLAWAFSTAGAGLVTAIVIASFLLHGQVQPPVSEGPGGKPAVVAPNTSGTNPPDAPDTELTGGSKPEPVSNPPVHVIHPGPSANHGGKTSPAPAGPAKVGPGPGPVWHNGGSVPIISRSGNGNAERMILEHIAAAKITEGKATDAVADNLGEAGLAMNETIERMRGTLRKAADLVVSEYPKPVDENTDSDGGDIQ